MVPKVFFIHPWWAIERWERALAFIPHSTLYLQNFVGAPLMGDLDSCGSVCWITKITIQDVLYLSR